MLVEVYEQDGAYGYLRDGLCVAYGYATKSVCKAVVKRDHATLIPLRARMIWCVGPAPNTAPRDGITVVAHIRLGR
jgi:hypothetical protein